MGRETDRKDGLGRRHIICRNPGQAATDVAMRIEIVDKPESKLSSEEPRGLVTTRGSRRYRTAEHSPRVIHRDRFGSGKRFDDIRAPKHRATP